MDYILIVEIQAPLRQQLVRLIEQRGHCVTAVATVREAFNILRQMVPELLATDVTLTDGSSDSLVHQARSSGAKISMLTGNPERIVQFDVARQPYLSRPFPPRVLADKIEKVLATPPSPGAVSSQRTAPRSVPAAPHSFRLIFESRDRRRRRRECPPASRGPARRSISSTSRRAAVPRFPS
jgi:DNA-binding response OmpR family regulator